MLKGENIICISSIDWDFIWQGHQEIMSTLAANGNKVLFIENTGVRPPGIKDISRIRQRIKNWFKGIKGIRQERENLYIYSPLVLPFPYSRIARFINRHLILPVLDKWMKIMNFNSPIVWTFLPTPLSLDIIDNLNKKILIYYCIDSFTVSSVSAKKIRKSEKALLRKADLVFVTSTHLFNYCSRYSDKVYKFPFAVNFEKFEKARSDNVYSLDELKGIKRPIIGYVGGIHKWIDQKLVRDLAWEFPDYSFVFVGPIQTKISTLTHLKNIYFLGKKDHNKLPFLIKNFDVCIIPYLIADYTKNVYPTKLNEYHAMGKFVVSTDLPEIEEFNAEFDKLVLVGKTSEEFANCISKAVNNKDSGQINKRITSASKNSWTQRIAQMSNLLEDILKKGLKTSVDWQRSLLTFYKTARKRALSLGLAILFTYLFIFYTPLVWFCARPLMISDAFQKADAIVVFAGGVGESGMAGQGYQERVQHAVRLYRKGYANHLIFSSGYTYIFHEPQVMKALAVSLGMPEGRIILEDKAKNTYENVLFTGEILERNDWKEILLISSPYHMRRVSLVFRKNAPDTEVLYTPITKSLFYSHGINQEGKKVLKQISLQQLKGILHEYLGIIYYYFQGYI
ncbi:MAG: YdcF family protein [Candidatus Omnitrophica bacterium]|nr:YdcF family protein [Candidatus Omnitrophota bacterium]